MCGDNGAAGCPIDDIPPQLIDVNPPDGTVNFNGQTVELMFSELNFVLEIKTKFKSPFLFIG